MSPVSGFRSPAIPSIVLATLALAAARAAYDVREIAKDETLSAAAPLFGPALAQAVPVLLAAFVPVLALRWLAGWKPRPRGAAGSAAHPLAWLLGAGIAALVATEVALRAVEALDPRPEPIPAGALAPLLARAAGILLAGALVATITLRLALRRLSPGFPGRRTLIGLALLVAIGCAAGATLPGLRARIDDATTRARRLARLQNPPNVLLIVLDTVRADRISCYGFPEDTTPEIDRLASQGVTFMAATTPAPWTLPAHASLFTGLYPSEHGAHYAHLHLDDDATTLAEVLSELGYRTVGFSKKTWLSRRMGTLQGFEQYRDFRIAAPRERLLVARIAAGVRSIRRGRPERHADAGGAEIAGATSDWLRERARRGDRAPFLAFVNFNEAHLPFLPPRPYFLRYAGRMPGQEALFANLDPMGYIAGEIPLGPEDVNALRALYAGEIAYVDRQIGRIIAALEETGDLDGTIVIVTSDHGENIGDHALLGHVLCVYDTLLRIPLVVRYPASFGRGVIDTRSVQLTDLLPTIVRLVDPGAIDLLPRISGQSLVAGEDRGFALAEYHRPDEYLDQFPDRFPAFDTTPYRRDLVALEAGTMKLIEGSDGRRELYDLAGDPGEKTNLSADLPREVVELSGALARFRERLRARERPGEAPEIDAETREELRRLGYVK